MFSFVCDDRNSSADGLTNAAFFDLGSGYYAEPRVGKSIRNKHKDRNKLEKTDKRSNEREHLVPINHQGRESDCNSKSNFEFKGFGKFMFIFSPKNLNA